MRSLAPHSSKQPTKLSIRSSLPQTYDVPGTLFKLRFSVEFFLKHPINIQNFTFWLFSGVNHQNFVHFGDDVSLFRLYLCWHPLNYSWVP